MTKENKRKAWRFLIGYSLIPIITFINGIVYFMNENNYILDSCSFSLRLLC